MVIFYSFQGWVIILSTYIPHLLKIIVCYWALRWLPCFLCLVAYSCLTLCNPKDYSLPGSSVHGILQARILEWVAISFSRGSSWSRDWAWVSCIAGRFFTIQAIGKSIHVLVVRNGATMNIGVHVSFESKVFHFFSYIPKVGLLDHVIVLLLVFK